MHKRKHKDQCGNWMDTYGDMVTLLLCFFVLLYAISAIDQTKWANLVRSLKRQRKILRKAVRQLSRRFQRIFRRFMRI